MKESSLKMTTIASMILGVPFYKNLTLCPSKTKALILTEVLANVRENKDKLTTTMKPHQISHVSRVQINSQSLFGTAVIAITQY